jgi:hypothetical protein
MTNDHPSAKATYGPPALVVYGSFAALTAAGSNSGTEDGMGGRFRRA